MPDKTKGPHSTPRRWSQVYVDVPPSSAQRRDLDEPSPGPSLKENTPLRPSRMNSQAQISMPDCSSKISKKRKVPDVDKSDATFKPTAKKPKLDPTTPHPDDEETLQPKKPTATGARTKQDDCTLRCHQCQRWWPDNRMCFVSLTIYVPDRNFTEGLRCTLSRAKSKTVNERCSTQYCYNCIRKYDNSETLDSILSHDVSALPQEQKQRHAIQKGHWFECYRCRGQCDCHVCRRARGLEPIGNLKYKARQVEKAEAIARQTDQKAEMSSQAKERKLATKVAGKSAKVAEAANKQAPKVPKASSAKPKAKPKQASKLKPLPKPLWTRVPTNLALEDAVFRLHIREFIVRFAPQLQLPRSCIDELEEISGDSLGPTGGWDVDVDDRADVVNWVSDLCARSIIQGLLDAIATWADAEGDSEAARALKEAVKAVKASGSNLNRIWGALASLREALGTDSTITFSDPLPPPASAAVRTTRSTMHGNDLQAISISTSAQLVPVIADLIEHAIQSPVIREAFDLAVNEEKELSKMSREATTKENTRWKTFAGTKDKQHRDQHNKLLHNIEFSQRLAAFRFIPRWAPLGQDFEGRVYYAMTPGIGETDAAIECLNGKESRVKVGRKRDWTEEDRAEMLRWTWFIAVWGKKPAGADEAQREDQDEKSHDVGDEAWWGFWQPVEVHKLAEWLAIKFDLGGSRETYEDDREGAMSSSRKGKKSSGLQLSRDASPLSDLSDTEDEGEDGVCSYREPAKHELTRLVCGLREYAELLEWRIQRASRERSISPEPEKLTKRSK